MSKSRKILGKTEHISTDATEPKFVVNLAHRQNEVSLKCHTKPISTSPLAKLKKR